ncbi:hypothetical protein CASFOL_034932 [Castilleja foliolosa]|uniref:S-protein homolog n=1 Tax=Castilleja foliolosa TaxID=1961234 RepID=A0ABD3BTL4_9LAMI
MMKMHTNLFMSSWNSRMASTSFTGMLFIFLLSPYIILETNARMYGKHTVNIISELPENSSHLIAECKSKNDDIGKHELSPGQSFSWRFRTNIWSSTLFYCYFWWGAKYKAMDVFDGTWDSTSYYHMYSYVLNVDGVYLSNEEKNHTASLGLVSLW